MTITRANIVKYWAFEPIRHHREGWINLNNIPLPDLTTLSPSERDFLRGVLQRHPEYLLEAGEPYGERKPN
jgi:hypothetical protein